MKLVIIESPYAGDIERNKNYLRLAVLDSLKRGESPYASHAFFTQFLDDNIDAERALGIDAGIAWAKCAELVAVYEDYGLSGGMRYGISKHTQAGRPIEYRKILGDA